MTSLVRSIEDLTFVINLAFTQTSTTYFHTLWYWIFRIRWSSVNRTDRFWFPGNYWGWNPSLGRYRAAKAGGGVVNGLKDKTGLGLLELEWKKFPEETG